MPATTCSAISNNDRFHKRRNGHFSKLKTNVNTNIEFSHSVWEITEFCTGTHINGTKTNVFTPQTTTLSNLFSVRYIIV